jgi:hypothetical protein
VILSDKTPRLDFNLERLIFHFQAKLKAFTNLDIQPTTKTHAMKIYIALILSCASALGADTGVQVITTTQKVGVHKDGIYKRDVFTRDGKRDLVCDTRTEGGSVAMRMQSFYHDGSPVARSTASPVFQDFVPEPGSQYSVSFRLHPSGELEFVYISGKDGNIVDAFTCTNGVYFPVDNQMILERNDAIKKAREADELRRFLIAQ